MNKGFVFCAVVCSALALAVFAGFFEFFNIPVAVAILLLLALGLIFHGVAIYTSGPRTKSENASETNRAGAREPVAAILSEKKS